MHLHYIFVKYAFKYGICFGKNYTFKILSNVTFDTLGRFQYHCYYIEFRRILWEIELLYKK